MKHYCQSENYFSLETLNFILEAHEELVVTIYVTEKEFRLKLWTRGLAYYLGCSRRLLRIPSESKYPFIFRYLKSLNSETWIRLLHVEMFHSKKR